MEYRKLISFGKSSYVVSLPRNWVTQNKLKKGDLIYIDESGPNLVLSRREQQKDGEEKEKIISVDGKTILGIGREVCSAYILNYRKIVLKGKEIKSKIKDLQGVIQNLIALEIMEQTSDTLIAKDFLNMEKVSINELIKKMDIVTRTMFKEGNQIFVEDNYENINERDRDVNRLYFLIYRAAVYNLENPSNGMKNFKLGPIDLMRLQNIAFYIEAIADEVRRIVRYARLLKVSKEKEKQIIKLFEGINEYYLGTMKAVYAKDADSALELSDLKRNFDKELDFLEKDVKETEYLNQLINRMRRITTNIHNLGRVVYTLI